MSDAERMKQFMESDFLPLRDRGAMPSAEHRIATALEYIAYHIGQIDKKLDGISSSLATTAAKM
jgi:hypothetical protein